MIKNNIYKHTFMINIDLNGNSYTVKNLAIEMTLGEFETISGFLNDPELDKIDKYTKIFTYQGIPEEVIEDLEIPQFLDLVSKFVSNEEDLSFLSIFQSQIEIEGRIYTAFKGDKFTMNVKQMRIIERAIKMNPNKYLGEFMAAVYQDDLLDTKTNFTDAIIKEKANIFRQHLRVEVALPFIAFFSQELINNIQNYSKL
jgi:hypothetical protein